MFLPPLNEQYNCELLLSRRPASGKNPMEDPLYWINEGGAERLFLRIYYPKRKVVTALGGQH